MFATIVLCSEGFPKTVVLGLFTRLGPAACRLDQPDLSIDTQQNFLTRQNLGFAQQKTAERMIFARKLFVTILACVTLSVLMVGGCANPTPVTPATEMKFAGKFPIRIVCTTGMVADLVSQVGGKQVEVTALMGAGVDPHLYKASPGDARLLQSADMIVYSGLHLEGKMTDLFERLAQQKPTFAVTAGMEHQRLLSNEAGVHDPHVWFDVELWSTGASVVRDRLAEFDPEHADLYRERCSNYQQELAKLHAETKEALATIPPEQRVMVTAHDAFRYFGRAYEVDVRGIQGISTESEAGVKQVNDLVNFLIEQRVKAVFVETSVSDQNVKSLVEGCGAQGHLLKIGGELYSDAMGTAGTPEGTYAGMIRHNVSTIVSALK